jgi:predicted transcriptional regulator of viral defense system
MNTEKVSMSQETEKAEKQHLMTLREAAETSGIPYNTLRNAVHAKHRRLAARQLAIGGYLVWYVTPEDLHAYEQAWSAAPWKRKP